MRSAARLSSIDWNATSTVWRYEPTLASKAARAASRCAHRSPPSNTVCEIDGPTDQNRLGHVNHWARLEVSRPPDALSVTVGKKAALATPICAFVAATRRSAAATSGRRSRSSDGTPTGIAGGAPLSGLAGI